MKRIMIIAIMLFTGIGLSWSVTIAEIIQKQDKAQEFKTDITAKNVFTQTDKGETKRFEMVFYRRDKDDSFLMVFTAPENEKGKGYLKIGDNFWMYLPNTGSFQQVNRDESIGGSDAKGGDFEKRKYSELYEGAKDANGKELISEEMISKTPVYKFEVVAKVNDVTYPKQIVWVTRDKFLTLKVQSFSQNGTLMQTAMYSKYLEKEGRYIPMNQLFVDEFEKGNKTLIQMSDISFAPLSETIFTKTYLKNLSK